MFIGAFVLVLVSTACATAPAPLSQADIDAIKATSRTYTQTALAKDWSKWATTFAADAKFLVPNSPILEGAPAIQQWGIAFPALKSMTLEPIEIEGYGNTAWTRGRYSFVAEIPGQGELSDTGKYIEIWRKQSDGSWKLYRDIFNSDLPLPAPPASDLAGDPMLGTWVLNITQSKFSPGPAPRSETRNYVLAGNAINATSQSVDATGKPVTAQWTVTYDGADRPISGSADVDAQSLKRIDAHTLEFTLKRGGKVVMTGARVITKDGKRMTITRKGINAAGQTVNNVEVFEKR